MKKYIIIKDKKLLYYTLVLTLIYLLMLLTTPYSLNYQDTEVFGFIYALFIIISFYMLFVNSFIVRDLLTIIKIKENQMNFGMFGLKSVYYNEITDIVFGKDIILNLERKLKKIRVLNIDENEDKYIEIFEALKKKTSLDINSKEAVEIIKSSKQIPESEYPKRLNGWIMVIFLSILFTGLGHIVSASVDIFNLIVNSSNFELSAFLIKIIRVIVSIIVLLFIIKRHKFSIKAIIGYQVITLICTIVSIIINSSGYTIFYNISNLIFTILFSLAFTLLVFRYLKISALVKRTFIYDEFQKIQLADKETDPPFKIFSKEPSSLYVLFTWLMIPALMLLSILVSFLVMIISMIIIAITTI